jgi:hypothetical protein
VLSRWLRPDLGQNTSQRADARRQWIAVVIDGVVKAVDQSGGFVLGWVKVLHDPDMGTLTR